MSGIFISYRRDDSRGTAGRLYDDLKDHFGEERVFRDLDAIAPGVDYTQAIDGFIESCDAVVVVIGNQWLDIRNEKGRRRIAQPGDVVRHEIAAALTADKLLIPVLVEDAEMPSASRLPKSLAALARRNAHQLSDARWDYDVGLLIEHLEEVVPESPPPVRPAAAREPAPLSLPSAALSNPHPPVVTPVASGWSTDGNDWSRPAPARTPVPARAPSAGEETVPRWAWGTGTAALAAVLVVAGVLALGGGGSESESSSGPNGNPFPLTTVVDSPATSAAPSTSRAPAGETAITLSPASGQRGTSITVSGQGFDPVETVEIRFHVGVLATEVTDANGAFSGVVIKVPNDAFKGFPYEVTATGKRSIKSASAPFTVS